MVQELRELMVSFKGERVLGIIPPTSSIENHLSDGVGIL